MINEVMAPSMYGHEYIKQALLYSLVGGQEKVHENKHRSRGDINILILRQCKALTALPDSISNLKLKALSFP